MRGHSQKRVTFALSRTEIGESTKTAEEEGDILNKGNLVDATH